MMLCGNDKAGLNNLENESKPIQITDDMGREKFWEDLGRPDGK